MGIRRFALRLMGLGHIEEMISTSHPNGHFYSPVVDPGELSGEYDRLWPEETPKAAGVDFNDRSHQQILREFFPKYFADFDFPANGTDDEHAEKYFVNNSQFSWLDARALFVLMREWRPKRIIEVGAGYSTLLMAEVNSRFLDGSVDITAIEPFPRPFLKKLTGVRLVHRKIQEVSLDLFDSLNIGDILFIDSSHISKTGSDVNFLYLAVLPRLKPGVRIHIHDIYLPCEYPVEWVITENRSWNEQYLVHALLMFSSRFRVLFGSYNAYVNHKQLLGATLGRPESSLYGGGSFWIEVI